VSPTPLPFPNKEGKRRRVRRQELKAQAWAQALLVCITLTEKIGQMMQVKNRSITSAEVTSELIEPVLGGDGTETCQEAALKRGRDLS
jgi:hypothetical protein